MKIEEEERREEGERGKRKVAKKTR